MNGNLVPVATNQNGVPVLFQDRNSGMFYLQTQYGLVASDANGNPLQQQQQQSFGYNPQQQQQQSFGYNQQQQQMMPSVGGSKYGNKYGQQQQQQTFGIGGIPNNTLPNNNASNVTSKYGNKYGQQQQQQMQTPTQQQPANAANAQVNVVNSTYIPEGYKAQPGSEFIPLYDETTEDLDVVVDENSKTYKFIIIKK